MTRPVTVTDRTGLAQALRHLKLSGMLATLDARLAQARAGELGHLDFLQVLCEDEITRRDTVSLAKRLRRARFEEQATLEGFDFNASPKLPAAQIRDLAALRWLHAGESVILYGPAVIRRLNFSAACSPRSGHCCDRCDDVRWLRAAGSSRAG
jgi:DNA replication protein DnaC